MNLTYKDAARFLVPGDSPAMVEVTVSPAGGQWEAVVRVRKAGQAWVPLGRRFRTRAKGEALGKIVRWVRGKYPEASPLSQRRARDA